MIGATRTFFKFRGAGEGGGKDLSKKMGNAKGDRIGIQI